MFHTETVDLDKPLVFDFRECQRTTVLFFIEKLIRRYKFIKVYFIRVVYEIVFFI